MDMARKVRDARLDSREARSKLRPRGKCYWRTIERELHVGYRRLKGKAGTWWARHYIGNRNYEFESLGIADDLSDADGVAILNFWQAQEKARERMVSRAHAANGGSNKPLSVRATVEDYLEWLESNRKSAYDSRRRAEAFIYPRLGDIACDALTTDTLRKWHAGLAKEAPRLRTAKGQKQRHRSTDGDEESVRRRQASANRVFTILKAALNHGFRDGKITSDGVWRKVKPFRSVDAARIRYLTLAEAQRLINAADTEFRPLLRAALETGARYGELIRLQVHDFNPEAGTIAIRRSKSGKARHVVLTEEGAVFFRQQCIGRVGSEQIFRRSNGSQWKASHQGRPMAAACERAKIKPRISFHGLRHTWASLAVMNAVPLLVVARNLGHADTRMVERHYGHLAPSYITDAIRAGAPRFGFEVDQKVIAAARSRERSKSKLVEGRHDKAQRATSDLTRVR
jgi:integrase